MRVTVTGHRYAALLRIRITGRLILRPVHQLRAIGSGSSTLRPAECWNST